MPRTRSGNMGATRGQRTGASSSASPLREDGFISAAARAWFDQGGNFVMERRIAPEVVMATGLDQLFEPFGLGKILRVGEGVFSPAIVREFYANAQTSDTTHSITSYVRHYPVEITPASFGVILHIPDNEEAHCEFREEFLQSTRTRWLSEVGFTTRHRGEENKDVLPFAILPMIMQRLLADILSHQIRPQAGGDASVEDLVILDYLLAPPPPVGQRISIPFVMFRQLHKVVSYLRTKKKKITPIFPFVLHQYLASTLPDHVFTDVKVREGGSPISLKTFQRWGFILLDDGTWVRGSFGLGATVSSSTSNSAPTATAPMQPPTPPVMSIPPELQTMMDNILQQQQLIQQQFGDVQQRQERMEGHIDDIRQTQQHLQTEQTTLRDTQALITQRLERSDALQREAAQFMAATSTQQAQTSQLLQMLLDRMGAGAPPPQPPQ